MKLTVKIFAFCYLLASSILLIFNMMTLQISDLSNTSRISYTYSLNISNDQNTRLNEQLNDDKYFINSITLAQSVVNGGVKIDINKTVSKKNLLTSLVPDSKFILFTATFNKTMPIHRDFSLIQSVMFMSYIGIFALSATILLQSGFLFCKHFFIYLSKKVESLSTLPQALLKNDVLFGQCLLLFTIFIVGYVYLSNYLSMDIFFNSDELFLADFYKNIFNHSSIYRSISDWVYPQVPFLFPDYIIYFFAYIFSSSVYFAFFYYMIIQIILFYLLSYFVLQSIFCKRTAVFLSAIIILLCSAFAIFNEVYSFIFLSIFHFGSFLNGLLILILLFYMIEKKNTLILHIFLSIVIIASALSDEWVVVWFVLPYIFAILLIDKNYCSLNIKLLIILNLFLSAIVGVVSYQLIIPNPIRPNANLISLNIGNVVKKFVDLYGFIKQQSVISFVLGLFWIGVFFLYITYRRKNLPVSDKGWKINFCIQFSLMSVFFSILVIFSFSFMTFTWRYLIPLSFIPIFIIVSFGFMLNKNNMLYAVFLGCPILLLILLNSCIGLKFEYYPQDIECIDRVVTFNNIDSGVGQYWDARRFNFLTKSAANIFPINGLTQKHYEFMDYKGHVKKDYEFAIVESQLEQLYTVNQNILLSVPNNALKMFTCGDKLIYIR